jgi:hypothetical protein
MASLTHLAIAYSYAPQVADLDRVHAATEGEAAMAIAFGGPRIATHGEPARGAGLDRVPVPSTKPTLRGVRVNNVGNERRVASRSGNLTVEGRGFDLPHNCPMLSILGAGGVRRRLTGASSRR